MKSKKSIICIFAAAVVLSSCATNKVGTLTNTGETIFDHAHDGILPSFWNYFGNEPEYEVHGPRETDDMDKNHGWTEYSFVTHEAEDTIWRIKYVKNRSWAVKTVDISFPADDLFLGKYIGKPKADVLRDFPDTPLDKGFVIFYESEDFLISFSIADEKVSHINILTKDKKLEAETAVPPADDEAGAVRHSPLLAKDITLDGSNWIKTQFRDNLTGEPLANCRCIVYVIQGNESGEIHSRTDENGWLYIMNIPDGESYVNILGED